VLRHSLFTFFIKALHYRFEYFYKVTKKKDNLQFEAWPDNVHDCPQPGQIRPEQRSRSCLVAHIPCGQRSFLHRCGL